MADYNARRTAYVQKRDTDMESYTQERLLRSVQAHRGKMTKLITLAETLIGICTASPSRRATQELEKIKRELDDKCLDTEAGLEILARRATEGDAMDKEAATRLAETRAIHSDVSKLIMRVLATAPTATPAGNAAPNAEEGSVKPKTDLKPKTLTLDFNPQEFQAWQEKFKIYYQASRMANGSIGEQRGYLYSCIEESLQASISRSLDPEAPVFRSDELDETEVCMDILENEFEKKFPTATRRFELFGMKQPRGKPMSTFLNTMLDAADMANIYTMSTDELMITLAIAACTDENLRRDLIKARVTTIGQLKHEVNLLESNNNTAKRLSSEVKVYATYDRPQRQKQRQDNKQKGPNEQKRPLKCFRCGEGHKITECKIPKEKLACTKCNKKGHNSKACRGIGKPATARQTIADTTQEEEEEYQSCQEDSNIYQANMTRTGMATPPLLM